MNITMIGDSAVGKTTFMMSTYGLMVDGDIEGFRVKCKDEGAHKKLIRAYNDFRTEGEYPPATVQMSTYQYDFYSNNEWVMEFSLTDIRGESIHDYDVDALSRDLRNSNAMMLFLNAYDILNGVDVSEQLDDINILLNNCFVSSDDEKLIMVIFSQMDRVGDLSEEKEKMLIETVSDLQHMAKKNDNIVFQIVLTACSLDCMMNLDFAMVTLMLFGYSTEVIKRRKKLEAESESIRRQYGEYDSTLRRIGRGFLDAFGWDEERNRARRRAEVLNKELAEHSKMEEKFERLRKFYDEYELGTFYRIKRRHREKDPFAL